MKKILILLLTVIVCNAAKAQTPPYYEPQTKRIEVIGVKMDSVATAPRFCGTPWFPARAWIADGSIGQDTCNHRFYIYMNGSWTRMAKYGEIPTLSDSITWRIGGNDLSTIAVPVVYGIGTKSAHDLILMTNNTTRAIIPSTGIVRDDASTDLVMMALDTSDKKWKYKSIPTGSTGSNIGSGYRLAVPGSNNVKTLFAGWGLKKDSTTNTNGITDKVDSATIFPAVLSTVRVTNNGYERPTYSDAIRTFNIPRNERDGFVLSKHKLFVRQPPYIIGDSIYSIGNSYAGGSFIGGVFYMAQAATYYGKTWYANYFNGGDLNHLNVLSHSYTFNNTATTIVGMAYAPAFGFTTAGQPGAFYYYNEHPNSPQVEKTANYIVGGYRYFLTRHYMDTGHTVLSDLTHTGFRTETAADSVGSFSGTALKGVGTITTAKKAGATSWFLFTRGCDSTLQRGGTITVSNGANVLYSKYMNGLNDGNRGNQKVIKVGLSMESILLKNLPDSAMTLTITVTGDSTWLDIAGNLKPVERAQRPCYLDNVIYGQASAFWAIPDSLYELTNRKQAEAVNDFAEYPVFILNFNGCMTTSNLTGDSHLGASGNDSAFAILKDNIIPIKHTPVKDAPWTSSGTDANRINGNVGIGKAVPTEKLDVNGNIKASGTGVFGGDVTAPDEAYDATNWNSSLEVPTKNAIRDKIESLGGGGSPAGNYGNIQLNRNSAFATPGSDSLDFESATGFQVKGNIGSTGDIDAAGDLYAGTYTRIGETFVPGFTFFNTMTDVAFYGPSTVVRMRYYGPTGQEYRHETDYDGNLISTLTGSDVNFLYNKTIEVYSGGLSTTYTATATSLTLNRTHSIVNVTATGQTITLPTATGITGRQYTIKLTASGSAIIDVTGGGTIDGSPTYSLASQYKYVTIVADGANYIITANN